MKYAGHNDSKIFNRNYQSNNNNIDGIAISLRKKRREKINDLFRELTLSRNLNLWQYFSAEK
jgi:hypothetical protein